MTDLDVQHLDGVPWNEAPLPRRLHRCHAQTTAWMGFEQVLRCACGAIRNPRFSRLEGGRWLERNTRRKTQ